MSIHPRRLVSLATLCLFVISLFAGPQVVQAKTAPIKEPSSSSTFLQFTAGGHVLGFHAKGMYAATGSHALHVDFLGANIVQPQADDITHADGKAAPLNRVTYADLWPGITLTYDSTVSGIYATTYTLAPGADPNSIQLGYNARLDLNPDGSLRASFETGALTETRPIAWQMINNQRVPVQSDFTLKNNVVGFSLGTYDPRYSLTIDPTSSWVTFLGGSGGTWDLGRSIAVDGSGNVYVTGSSDAAWGTPPAPTVRAYTVSPPNPYDAFVAKLDSSGNLLWNTFLGGLGDDLGWSIAVDGSGNVFVAGDSSATWGAPPLGGGYAGGPDDAFAAKLDSSGTLLWNTFMGAVSEDHGYFIALDGSGNSYVTGWSQATWGGALTVRAYTASSNDAFVAKLNSTGVLQWNTFLGGGGTDVGWGVAVFGGNVYVSGLSDAAWSGPPAPVKRAYSSGIDAFAAQLNSTTGALLWNTFLGGGGDEYGYSIAVDGSGNAYITGQDTASWGTPIRAFTVSPGNNDAFAAKLDSSGNLLWNTFLGGSGHDVGQGIAVDTSGNAYVAGTGDATWGSPLRSFRGDHDAFGAKLDTSGNLLWNTFLGGSGWDYGFSIAVDGGGNVYMSGGSDVTWGAPVRAYSGGDDAFASKLDIVPPTVISSNPADGATVSSGPTQITVNFSEDVLHDSSVRSGNNTSNYLLVEDGANGVFNTASCSGGVVSDDAQQSITLVAYTNNGGIGPFTANLYLASALPVGTYRLFVCGTTSVEDIFGNKLNYGTSDAQITFTVGTRAEAGTVPKTGFPMGQVTILPIQPADKAYTATDLILEIPSLNVKMTIVGVPQSNGSWDVSWLGNNAGWLSGSAYPTWAGNTVLTGHVWDAYNNPGPFAKLKSLQYGDKVLIHAFGQTYTYEVRESRLIMPGNTNAMLKHEDLDWVTLVTCEFYNPITGNYFMRRMVRAVLVSVAADQ